VTVAEPRADGVQSQAIKMRHRAAMDVRGACALQFVRLGLDDELVVSAGAPATRPPVERHPRHPHRPEAGT
jgi:hypothetical protein